MTLLLRCALVVTMSMLFTAACNSRGGRGNADSGMSGNDAGPSGDSGSACSCDTSASCQASCSCDTDCAAVLCTDTCSSSGDDECDDGGPDSVYSICDLGTDCTDCGPRTSDGGDGDCTSNDDCTSPGTVCVEGSCQTVDCTPNCGTRTCGDNGCGAPCGTCTADERCDVGYCVATVNVGASCESCDEIYASLGHCFQTGSSVIAECGGASAGNPLDIPWCRRGAEGDGGYCTTTCTSAGDCRPGYSCREHGSGGMGCLAD